MVRWSLVAVLGCCAAAGCSLLVSTDGLNGAQAADAGVADSSSAIDVAAVDAPVDARPSDSGSPPGPCDVPPKPFFCANFDDGRTVAQLFPILSVSNATFAVDEVASKSAPGALGITLPSGTTTNMSAAGRVALPPSATKLTLDAEVRVDALGSPNEHDFIGFFHDETRELTLEVRPDGMLQVDEDIPVVVDGGPDERKTALGVKVTEGKWFHVHWEIVVSGATATSRIRIDGGAEVVVTSSSEPVLAAHLEVGDAFCVPVTKPWRSRLDDVVLRIE